MIWASLEFESLERELRLDDARRLHPGPEHVLLRGHVVGAAYPVEGVEIVGGAVVELVLARPREAVLHPLVHPQPPHQLTDLVRQLNLVPLARHLEEEPRVLLQRPREGYRFTEGGVTKCTSRLLGLKLGLARAWPF